MLSKCQSISDYPLLEPDEAGQTSSSTSGSGSGSGDLLLPQPTSTMQTIPPGVLEYGTMYYITLTFQNLTQKLYHDHGIEDILEELLIELLMLDAEPLILLEGNTVLVYFPIQQSSLANLHMYVQLLMSTNNTEWQRLAEAYVSIY